MSPVTGILNGLQWGVKQELGDQSPGILRPSAQGLGWGRPRGPVETLESSCHF